MGWLADCSESERAAVLAKLAGRHISVSKS